MQSMPVDACAWRGVFLPKASMAMRSSSDTSVIRRIRQVRSKQAIQVCRLLLPFPSTILIFSPFLLFFFIMHSHWSPTKDPREHSIPFFHHTSANMSTNAIWLETFASAPRYGPTDTNEPDLASDAPQQGSSSPPDAHPPENINHAQSSQEVVRMPSPRLRGEARESAGSQGKSINLFPVGFTPVFCPSYTLSPISFAFFTPQTHLVVEHPSRHQMSWTSST